MVSSYKLAELWQRLGYRVVVACMAKESGKEVVSDTLTIYRRKDLFLPDPLNFGISFGFAGMVRRILKEENIDQIVINKILFWTSWSILPLKLTGHKVLVLTDALVGMTWWPRGLLPKIIMGIGGWTMGWLTLLCAHRIVFFHPQPESLLKQLGVSKKYQVIPTGIDPSSFAVDMEKHRKETITATYVGRLESVKGVDDFLAALVPLREQYPHLEVQVVGFYKDDNPLVRQYQNQVRFTGLRDDIPDILAASQIFVMPSYSEGLSNALMEAMSSGCACIASEVGGNCFLVQNGVSGFLFPAGDREALQSHVRRLLDDPAKMQMLGAGARSRIEELFSWESVGKQYGALFQDLDTTDTLAT